MKIVIALLITTLINFVLFVPSSPVNLLLYLFIKETILCIYYLIWLYLI